MRNVLVVDDSETYRVLVERYLKLAGFRVWLAPSALHALQVLHNEVIDVLLADERMLVGGSGLLLLEATSRTWPEVSLALVSGAPTAEGILRASDIGARVFTKGAPREIVEFVYASPRRRRREANP